MDVSAVVGWQEHSIEHDGLFDLDFLPQIGLALGTSEAELRSLHKLSQNIGALPALAAQRSAGNAGGVMADAYVVAALLRGRYHDSVNRMSHGQLTHHPIRDAIALEVGPDEAGTFRVTNVMTHLGALLIASAFVEKDVAGRTTAYLENLGRLKGRIGGDYEALRSQDFAERVEEEVVRIADEAGISTRSHRSKELLEVGTATGFAALTAFVLLPWSPVVTVAGSTFATFVGDLVLRRARLGETAAEGFRREHRLRDLHNAGSGLVRSRWKPPETP
jgi:hypothetical protein